MDRLVPRIESFRRLVEEHSSAYAGQHLVFEIVPDGKEYILRVVHDSLGDVSLAKMRQCRTYIVMLCVKRFETVESRMCVVHGRMSRMSVDVADALLRKILNNARPAPTLDCRDKRLGKSTMCRFGIQPTVLKRPTNSGPNVYKWKKVLQRPPHGREIVNKALYTELKKRDSVLWTELSIDERVMKHALPVALKYRWRMVTVKPPGESITHCNTLLSLLRNDSVIRNLNIWAECLIPEPLFDTHYAHDSSTGEYYIPAPVDLTLGDYIQLDNGVFYIYFDNPHTNQGGQPLEDRRFYYVPAFTWSGEDCDTELMLSAVDATNA